ncbi:MAG: InlB B-repeat-containing protein [Bacilli bacterium]|jgi:hypothetical protein
MKKIVFLFLGLILLLSACRSTHTVNITYQTNDGNVIPMININSASPQWNPTIPLREGYLFVHYCIDESLSTPYTPEALLNNKSLTLYARWLEADNETEVIVSFVTSGGTYISSQLILKGTIINEPTSPSMGKFAFSHWTYYDVFEGKEEIFDFAKPINDHTTLYAQYE